VESAVTAANREAVEAWDGVLFDRFSRFRHQILPGLGAHGDRALELHPPRPGERVLDIGCGFGDTAHQIAAMVQPGGEVVGVDASPRFIEAARTEADEAGLKASASRSPRSRRAASRVDSTAPSLASGLCSSPTR
jgi:2-polyprenyl-3-methyl-5-hydroxy-6-metoxy-1,4-benzoquinol methylase